MARQARAGELRTKIMVFDAGPDDGEVDADGNRVIPMENVLGEGRCFYCKWVNAHGNEVYIARQAQVTEPATLTLRYTPKIKCTAEVHRVGDPEAFEIISINDVENRHIWLELRVQRKTQGR